MATQEICGCFGNLRTRYKRLVDKIFPSDPSQGLVNSNMEKLRFYALSAPEKLDRIGGYMYMKMNNHLYRKRTGWVMCSLKIMHLWYTKLYLKNYLKCLNYMAFLFKQFFKENKSILTGISFMAHLISIYPLRSHIRFE